MSKDRKTEIKVGITVIFGVILFIWVLGWAKNFSITNESQLVKVEFNTVSGLNEGDVVTVNGVKKGFVDKIELKNNKALTTLNIDDDIKLYSDASFAVSMLDLMGGKKVEILPGESGQVLSTETIHEGVFVGDIASAMSTLSSVQTDIVVLIKEVRSAVTKVNTTFLSDEFIAGINDNLTELNKLLKISTSLITNNSQDISRLIDSSNSLVDKSNRLLNENGGKLSRSIDELESMLKKSNSLLERLEEFSNETKAGENNIGKLMYDENLFSDMKETLIHTNKLIRILLNQIEEEGIKVDANIF